MTAAASGGLLGFFGQADGVGKAAALLLLAMSIATWYLLVTKAWRVWRIRRQGDQVVDAFWAASDVDAGIGRIRAMAPDSPFVGLATAGAAAASHHQDHPGGQLSHALDGAEFVTREIRRAITRTTSALESGLMVLASVGSTAPFIGLFGTVWGIYHALIGIGFTGQATIDKVAGPVGEALIMTALGIAVAVPAVLGYNVLVRANRLILAELDGFAHDLHAFLATGARVGSRRDDAKRGA